MSAASFQLVPFPGAAFPPALAITGQIARGVNGLQVAYTLGGTLAGVRLPDATLRPTRRDHLWEHTCFELFVAPADSAQYWEFNLSPSGDWNAYRFTGYRAGRQDERAFAELPCLVERAADRATLSASFVATSSQWAGPLDIGVSAVMEDVEGDLTYWALAHAAAIPDFHRRGAFAIRL